MTTRIGESAYSPRLMSPPFKPVKENTKAVRRLIVLPVGWLPGVPVEALTDRYTVSYIPSGTVFARLREQGAIGPAYRKSPLRPDDKGAYLAGVDRPVRGWTAFFVELVFDSGDEKVPYKFTTQVQIVPDVLPHSFEEWRKSIKKGAAKGR